METKNPKVCILAAGRGTRLAEFTQSINKALLPVKGKAVISQIIDKFPAGTEFVIALGYKGKIVQDYLALAHPQNKFTFVNVENFDGPGSGPGHSMLCCRNILGESDFYFVPCDTMWSEKTETLGTAENWIAVATVSDDEREEYCTVKFNTKKVTGLILKSKTSESNLAFTGLAYVRDTEIFWQALQTSPIEKSEIQVIDGFRALAQQSQLGVRNITWTDVGLLQNYIAEIKANENYDFSKSNEHLYSFSGHVIKFFADEKIAANRVKKAGLNLSVFPKIEAQKPHFYKYLYQPGQTLYENSDPEVFEDLLNWLDLNLWVTKPDKKHEINLLCQNFYYKKTLERLEQFKKKYPTHHLTRLNGHSVPEVDELLQKINWEPLFEGHAYFIHGDLQPDNILYDDFKKKFLLLDWRQDFAGAVGYGDLYYDIAKLWGGINLNYKEIKNNYFSYEERGFECTYRYPTHPHFNKCTEHIKTLIAKKAMSMHKVQLLVGLIYLNMSPLHHYPFDKMLHAMGREIIFKNLEKN